MRYWVTALCENEWAPGHERRGVVAMSGIFSRIFRYRQSESRTPSEDYFTETFVAVLERCEPLRTAFVEWLIGPEKMKRENIKTVRFETQKTFAEGRPDIWVEARDDAGKRHVAIVENKIDAHQGVNQLSNYASILQGERNADSRTLVYLTKHSEEPSFQDGENMGFKHRRWFEVYRILAKVRHADPSACGDLGRELLNLMEDWNMDGTLSAAHLRAGVIYIDANVEETLRNAQNEAWDESRIDEFLRDLWVRSRNWDISRSGPGAQTSPPIMPYGVRLWMAFRFDRHDEDWDVSEMELPSPVLTVSPAPNVESNSELPQRPENWTRAVEGMSDQDLWVRQPTQGQIPRYGESLYDYYKEFFRMAFTEFREALENDRSSPAPG